MEQEKNGIDEIDIMKSAFKVIQFMRKIEPEKSITERIAILKAASGVLDALMGMKSASILMQNFLKR